MFRTAYLIVAIMMLASPASAQSGKPMNQKQCEGQFKTADINNDGLLSSTEIGNAKQNLPASIVNKDRVSRADFMAICGKRAS